MLDFGDDEEFILIDEVAAKGKTTKDEQDFSNESDSAFEEEVGNEGLEVCEEDEEEVDDIFKIIAFLDNSKSFKAICILLSAICIVSSLYIKFGLFQFKDRDLSDENIFNGNDLAISDEMLSGVVSELEDALNVTVDNEDYEAFAVLNAILKNENLTETEKEVFYRSYKIIKDNPYINKEAAYRSLLNVDVSYKKRGFSFDKDVEGIYSSNYETIGVFVKDPDNRVLLHEIIHCIFSNEQTKNLPTFFDEGMTELLANEYFSEKPFYETVNYPIEISAVKMLCEVSTPDAVLEAYSTGDMSIIAKEITKITRNEDDTNKALNAFELLMRQYRGEATEEEKVDNQTLINECIPIFRGIISAKFEEGSKERGSYYYNEILFASILEENPYDSYVDSLVELGYSERAYFSSELKAKVAEKKQIQKAKSIENSCNN